MPVFINIKYFIFITFSFFEFYIYIILFLVNFYIRYNDFSLDKLFFFKDIIISFY